MLVSGDVNRTIVITGVGGQGTLLASTVIGNAAVASGLKVRIAETFGMSQRGGSVVTHIRIGQGIYSPVTPVYSADLIIGFEPLEAYRNALKYLKPGGVVILNLRPVYVNDGGAFAYPPVEDIVALLQDMGGEVLALDATDLATKAGDAIMLNMVMLGAAACYLPFDLDLLRSAVGSTVKKDLASNLLAFDYGVTERSKRLKKCAQ